MLDVEGNFRFWLCIYPVVLLMRLFKSFAAQKRLAIVTDTFRVAYNDLMHFFVVFLSLISISGGGFGLKKTSLWTSQRSEKPLLFLEVGKWRMICPYRFDILQQLLWFVPLRIGLKWHLQKFSSNHSWVTIIKAINWYTNYFPYN